MPASLHTRPAAGATLRVDDARVPVKKHIGLAQNVVWACLDAIPTSFALVGIQLDVLRAAAAVKNG